MTPAAELALGAFLCDHGLLASPELVLVPLTGGRSNLTYRIESSEGTWVLRRPPDGLLAPTAHNVLREYSVLEAVKRGEFPAPHPLVACDDPHVIGVPFFVMDHIEGLILRDRAEAELLDPRQRRAAAEAAISTLARLHALDYEVCGLRRSPSSEPFLRRQISRWSEQWNRWRIEGVGEMDELAQALVASAPDDEDLSVVHGDYRLDNVILNPRDGSVAAVLDWELATVGDPLADLGLLLAYWADADAEPLFPHQDFTGLPGFPSRSEAATLYERLSGRGLARFPVYVAFGYFKWAAIRAGIYARYRAGSYTGSDGEAMATSVLAIATRGLRELEQAS